MTADIPSRPTTLAEMWSDSARRGPVRLMVLFATAGVLGAAGLALAGAPLGWSLALLVVGLFGGRGILERRTDRWRAIGPALDALAAAVAVALFLLALNALFSGTVGLIRA